jgi:Tol biopolymer transport system component
VLAKNLPTKGTLAWSPSGEEIWFDLDESGHTNVAAASLDGRIRTLYSGLDWLFLDDVAADGTVLLSRWAARSAIYFRGPGDAAERDLGWLDWGFSRDLSRDGSLLLFEELGAGGGLRSSVYARPTDGSPAIRLGDGSAVRLSADAKSALAIRDGRIVIYPIGSGQPRDILTGNVKADYASFFPDGRHLRVNGYLPGHERRNWMLDIETGAMRSITPEGPQQDGVISPDGRSIAVAFLKEKRIVVYPVDSGGGDGRPLPGTLEGDHPLEWSADGKSLYVYQPEEILPKHIDRIDVATGRREPWKTLAPSDGSGTFGISGIAMTPDAASYVYTAERALAGDLFVIEGLR